MHRIDIEEFCRDRSFLFHKNGSDLVATDNSGEVCGTALRMAQVISEQLDGCKGMDRNDVKDFATPAFGFVEKEEV